MDALKKGLVIVIFHNAKKHDKSPDFTFTIYDDKEKVARGSLFKKDDSSYVQGSGYVHWLPADPSEKGSKISISFQTDPGAIKGNIKYNGQKFYFDGTAKAKQDECYYVASVGNPILAK
jgi:hypothetical protein